MADPLTPDPPARPFTAEEMEKRAQQIGGLYGDDPSAAMLRQAADSERALAKVREWLTEPMCSEEDLSAALVISLQIQKHHADIAAVTALKAIADARAEVTALLAPTGGTT